MKTLRMTFWILGVSVAIGGAGCASSQSESDDMVHATEAAASASENGLASVNGLFTANGLATVNGLFTANGLATVNGLATANGLMTTASGRTTVSYLIRCALPAGRSITKKDQNGASYTFAGQLGFAPEWETSACGQNCQEYVTACMMAHINTAGVHIPLWLDATKIGWGQSSTYPHQEGSFFGNIFISPPVAYYCEGKDFALGVVPGRLGANQVGAPYKNPFAGWTSLYCKDSCTAADLPHAADGYKACFGYNNVVTVFRQ